jgi:hypothetical protein
LAKVDKPETVMQTREIPPEPDYHILCSDTSEWKAPADVVASHGRSMLLLGIFDTPFIEKLTQKYGLKAEVDIIGDKVLLWSPV